MQRFPRYCLLSTTVLALTLMALPLGQHLRNRTDPPLTLDGWDIRELAEHLNRTGLAVRLRTSQKDGTLANTTFLTTADESWEELNRLVKDSKRITEWRGTVFCERAEKEEREWLLRLWKGHCLAAGPFVFYGDDELLERIGDLLAPFAPPDASERRAALP
jgi:hypothetical protein